MNQNPLYVATGKKNNRTVEEAHKAERILSATGTPALGIVAFGNGGQRVELADFEANDINPDLPLNLEIRTSWGNGPDKDANGEPIENSVADAGEFQNVDKILDTLETAPDAVSGLSRVINMTSVGLTGAALTARIDSLPGVSQAVEAARKAAVERILNQVN